MDKFLTEIHSQLGITQVHLKANRLPLHEQPALSSLVVADIDFRGRPFVLLSSTAEAWRPMVAAALSENIYLKPFSGFRSYIDQKGLIEWRLKEGRILEEILTHVAIPGFSEHHSGRAIDIYAEGQPVLEESFEKTPEFQWLTENAARFGFRLSYPRTNALGIIYEPWHWFYTGK